MPCARVTVNTIICGDSGSLYTSISLEFSHHSCGSWSYLNCEFVRVLHKTVLCNQRHLIYFAFDSSIYLPIYINLFIYKYLSGAGETAEMLFTESIIIMHLVMAYCMLPDLPPIIFLHKFWILYHSGSCKPAFSGKSYLNWTVIARLKLNPLSRRCL